MLPSKHTIPLFNWRVTNFPEMHISLEALQPFFEQKELRIKGCVLELEGACILLSQDRWKAGGHLFTPLGPVPQPRWHQTLESVWAIAHKTRFSLTSSRVFSRLCVTGWRYLGVGLPRWTTAKAVRGKYPEITWDNPGICGWENCFDYASQKLLQQKLKHWPFTDVPVPEMRVSTPPVSGAFHHHLPKEGGGSFQTRLRQSFIFFSNCFIAIENFGLFDRSFTTGCGEKVLMPSKYRRSDLGDYMIVVYNSNKPAGP